MQIETFVLGGLQTNCYLLGSDHSAKAIIIDPADDGDFLNDELLRRNLTLEAVLLTHGHFDHCLGLLSLYAAWQMPIYLHPKDRFLLARAADSARHWLGIDADPVPETTTDIDDQEQLQLIDETWQVIHTPGHTPGSICLLHQENKVLFSGDTIFANGSIGRTDFAYSKTQEMKTSLQKLKELRLAGVYSQVFSGHGESFFV